MRTTAMFAEVLKYNIAYLVKTLEDISPEKYFIRPESRGNPLIWLLGHLVLNRGEIVEILGGNPSTGDLGDLFARGTKPSSDTSIYPDPPRLISRFVKLAAVTDHLLKTCDDALLEKPSWGRYETLGQNLAFSYMHETHHIGQITYIVNLPAIKVIRKQTSFARPDDKKNSTTKIILDSIKSVFSQ